MKKYIFGTTELSEILFYELNAERIIVDGFCVERDFLISEKKCGLPIVSMEDLCFIGEKVGLYLSMGYTDMNNVRKRLYEKSKDLNIKVLSFIHPSSIVMTQSIGEGCIILEHCTIGPYVSMGKCNIVYPRTLISHHCQIGDFNYFSVNSSIAGKVIVGDNCFVGNNATTKDGIHVADYSLLGALSYTKKDTKEGDVIVPAESMQLEHHTSKDFL